MRLRSRVVMLVPNVMLNACHIFGSPWGPFKSIGTHEVANELKFTILDSTTKQAREFGMNIKLDFHGS